MKRKIRIYDEFSSQQASPLLKWIKRLLVLGVIIFIGFIIWIISLSSNLPSLEQLEQYEPELASKIVSQDSVIIKELFTEKRILISLDEIPDHMWQAVLATEDHTFFKHWGVNLPRFTYVMLINLVNMSYEQGASTLTQQLARQLYLGLEKKVSRKLKEWITAVQIEKTYTKREILEMYLNHMNFGHGNYGVESASQYFFGKSARDLKVHESALLTGLLQRPSSISPYNPGEISKPDSIKRSFKRRNLVLHNMLRRGFIDRPTYEQAVQIPLKEGLMDHSNRDEHGIAPYYTEHIRKELQERYHMDLYKGGYTIYSTLDTRVQAAAEKAVKKHLSKLQDHVNSRLVRNRKWKQLIAADELDGIDYDTLGKNQHLLDSLLTIKAPVQVALVAIDPSTGYILAMIGGRDFGESKYNRAMQMRTRQPGSTFKPIIYAAAIDNGYSTTTELLNQPVVLYLPNGDRWAPHNYDNSQGGPTTFREALRRSLNLVTARVVQELVPPATVVDYAHKLGLTTNLTPVDAIALGATEVAPIEMTSAFGVFPNQGALAKPLAILKVVDKYGNVVEEYRPELTHVLSVETSYIMVDLLQTVLNQGTGAAARTTYQFLRPAGGKTGTTNEFTDAWFIGFTPQIVAGVWVGLDDPAMTLGSGQAGAVAALPIWAPFMKLAHDTLNLPIEYFQMPPGVVEVEICNETKKLATEFCPDIVKEIFDKQHVPTEQCSIHTGFRSRYSNPREENKKKRIR